jgi:hypothetical protein
MRTLESHSCLLYLTREKFRNRRCLYLDDHLDKLLDVIFVTKIFFLPFRKNIENPLEMLLDEFSQIYKFRTHSPKKYITHPNLL